MTSDGTDQVTESDSARAVVHPAVRFVFIDGLRGLAALGIVLYHTWRYEPALTTDPLKYASNDFVPAAIDWVLLRTWIGVQFLLVVSGFVIAFTLRNTWVTPREALSFIGRRIVRLWPPYAVTILFVLLLHAACVSRWAFPSPFEESPTFTRVLVHLTFMQDALGYAPLSAAIWTICIEMQFYVVSVIGWGLAQRLVTRPNPSHPRPSANSLMLVFAPFALATLLVWSRQDSTEAWVIHFLSAFFLGMLTWWTLDRTVPTSMFFVTIAVVAGHLAVQWKSENALALAATLAIFLAGRTNHFHDWLNWRWLQYLGRISYSLYLIHYPVSHFVMWLCWRWCDHAPTPAQATLILFTSFTASLAAGHLLYVTVEAPSGRWSTWLKNCRTG